MDYNKENSIIQKNDYFIFNSSPMEEPLFQSYINLNSSLPLLTLSIHSVPKFQYIYNDSNKNIGSNDIDRKRNQYIDNIIANTILKYTFFILLLHK